MGFIDADSGKVMFKYKVKEGFNSQDFVQYLKELSRLYKHQEVSCFGDNAIFHRSNYV